MKGIVERVELPGDPGLIRGEDGKTYRYSQSQVRSDEILTAGSRVDFISLGDEARDIYPVAGGAAGAGTAGPGPQPYSTAAGAAPAYRATVLPPANPRGNLWTYFTDGLTKKYAQFNGRARRAEYWGYTLFWWLITIGLLFLDSILLGLTAVLSANETPWWFFYLSILWQLGTLIPNIAIVVRRLHDQNMSGWLYLIKLADGFFFYIGTIVIFVLTLMDSKPEPNVHGPSPKYDQERDVASVFS